ncbi:metalloregulator ArsR/SmtB family transcription factor [Microbaculum marinum]|uniref:Metalloregulator ArsR/SmtB family transcription factor n=1 Tax=Microbaculum marinum TaxID=1764581 RepID=A0AAW9RJ82_9HYPH
MPETGTVTEDKVLFHLKMRGSATAAQIAERLDISPQAVRERLDRLSGEDLVTFVDEHRGAGRPKRVWRLSDAAWARFPDTHAELAVGLIDAVRDLLGDAALDRLIARRERQSESRYRDALKDIAPLADRVAELARQRDIEGYMAECSEQPDGSFLLVENHCPICAAARRCQNFCRAEQDIFARVLGPDCRIERVEHLLQGARRCAYRITPL